MLFTVTKKQNKPDAREVKAIISVTADELVAQCPACKTIETIYFSAGQLISTRKFFNDDGHIFHRCGSNEPCRLYRTF
jgi:phage FluMu protein Com